MEWVETTARSVDEAKELALDQLGVVADDAEFEVLEAPRQGLFGRTRGEARVRARVRPAPVRPKQDRRRNRRNDSASSEAELDRRGPAEPPRYSAAGATDRTADQRAASKDGT